MFLDNAPINYWGVLIAAIFLYVLGAIWYSPSIFGHSHLEYEEEVYEKKRHSLCKAGAYIGEFIISLAIAFVLSLFIGINQVKGIIEGIIVSFWAWLGFIATTHLSPVLWCRKQVKNYFIYVGFLLIGFIAMGAIIVLIGQGWK